LRKKTPAFRLKDNTSDEIDNLKTAFMSLMNDHNKNKTNKEI
jgi:hypothetical protein